MRYIYLMPIAVLLVLQMVSLGVIYDGIRESSMKDATIASITEQNSILRNDIQELRNIKRIKEDLGK